MTLGTAQKTMHYWRTMGALVLACAGTAVASAQQGSRSSRQALGPEQKLVVNVVDLTALANIESDFIREDFLENAFHRAAEDEAWIGGYQFRYNYGMPKDQGGYLEFNVVDWKRTAANVYEATFSASYRSPAGETIELGTFTGRKTGINVSTGWDVTGNFIESAEDAFEQALDALAARTGVS